nr:hypothetical protein [Armatimonadota bacterium]
MKIKPTSIPLLALSLIAATCLGAPSHAQAPPTQAGGATPFMTPLTADNIDPAVYGQWVDGAETPMPESKELHRLLWTQNGNPDWMGVNFGDSKNAGVRHLRIGFKTPVPVRTNFQRGEDQVSVL